MISVFVARITHEHGHDYRSQDKRYVYLAIGASAEGSTKMLDWLNTNWDKVTIYFISL